jgi:hypothetical protein
MRRAEPHELKTPARPIFTAHLSEDELAEWLPIPFDTLDDPYAVPEPSKAALVRLAAGEYVVVFYGQISQQLTVEAPESTSDLSRLMHRFFDEVPLPVSRVLWHREGTELPERVETLPHTLARR